MNRIYDQAEWRAAIDLARESDFALGAFRVRPSLCEIENKGVLKSIEPRVMQALVAFAQAKGSVVSRDELIQRCWGGRIVGEDAVNRCIAKVRKLAEPDEPQSFVLETIPRVGYRLVEIASGLNRLPAESGPESAVPSAAALILRAQPVWRVRPHWTALAA